ncbi:hypothetical protein [Gordonia phage MerCougar]|nr:hypothetical protein [Gordonia phage MerCougar]
MAKRKAPLLREGDLVKIGGVPHDVVSGTRFGYVVVRNIKTMAVKTSRPGMCDLIATREEREHECDTTNAGEVCDLDFPHHMDGSPSE